MGLTRRRALEILEARRAEEIYLLLDAFETPCAITLPDAGAPVQGDAAATPDS
jgi:hypothetical protein